MLFTLAIEKKHRATLTQAEGHNARHHPTRSQLPQPAWLTPTGRHQIKAWDSALADQARGMAKRKDAVLAVELVIQVGSQREWRDDPTKDCPQGKPKRGNTAKMNALIAGVREAIAAEVGWERVISADLHTDESSPHVHVVFAPIAETVHGKALQAKNWIGGAAKCAEFRERLHSHVTKHLACTYTKRGPGGEAHDPEKAAGKSGAPGSLRARVDALEAESQRLFSLLKAEQERALEVERENNDFASKAMRKVESLEAEIARLRPPPARQKSTEGRSSPANDLPDDVRRLREGQTLPRQPRP